MNPAQNIAACLATLALTVSGFVLMFGARRLAGGFALAALLILVIATQTSGAATTSALAAVPWWALIPFAVIAVGLLGIGILQLFVRLFLGRWAAATMAGQLARDLVIGVLLAPFRLIGFLLGLAGTAVRRRESVRRLRM